MFALWSPRDYPPPDPGPAAKKIYTLKMKPDEEKTFCFLDITYDVFAWAGWTGCLQLTG